VFSGDTRQLQSVEAGDALRILERGSGLRSVSLTQVQRQTPKAYRHAIETLRKQPPRGFAQLEAMGAVREVAWRDRSRSVAVAWREAHAHLNAQGQPSSVFVVCATHDDIAHVTAAIRAERQHAGAGRGRQDGSLCAIALRARAKDGPSAVPWGPGARVSPGDIGRPQARGDGDRAGRASSSWRGQQEAPNISSRRMRRRPSMSTNGGQCTLRCMISS